MGRKPWQEEVCGVEGIEEARARRQATIDMINDYFQELDSGLNFQVIIFDGRKVTYPILVETQHHQTALIDLSVTERHIVIVNIAKRTISATEEASKHFHRKDQNGEESSPLLEGFSFVKKTAEELKEDVKSIFDSIIGTGKKRRSIPRTDMPSKETKKKENSSPHQSAERLLPIEVAETAIFEVKKSTQIEVVDQIVSKGESDAITAMQKKAKEEKQLEKERRKEEARMQKQERIADDLEDRNEIRFLRDQPIRI
jgi:hypothetical protein